MNDNNKSEPATKDDLKELATKTDLNKLAQTTKTELQKLTGRIDSVEQKLTGRIDSVEQKLTGRIDSVEQKLTGRIDSVETTVKSIAIELSKTQEDVRQIKNDMSTKDDISRIMNHIDAFAAEALSYRNHDTLRGRAIMDHDDKLKNHETRISELETNTR